MFQEFLQQTYFNNRIIDYIVCFSIFIIGVLILRIFRSIVLTRLKKWAKSTATTLDDLLIRIIQKKLLPIFYLGIFYLSIKYLILSATVIKIINAVSLIIFIYLSVRLFLTLVIYVLETYLEKKTEDPSKKFAFKAIHTVIRVVFWTIALIVIFDNFGIKVSTLIAGLGIGGVAIALATQAILKDLFSYFIIFFDRPFEIGDFIIVGDFMGVVEHVGIKTTRLSSLGGEQIVFSNTDLTDSRVRNYKRMARRRVVFKLGVIYQTTSQQLREIPGIIEDIIKSIEDAIFDRAHFFSFGDFSIDFEIVYYVVGNDYNKYMNIQQEINLRIKEEFEKRKIEFAYPTQTLFLEK